MTHIQDKTIEGITKVLMENGFEKAMPQIMEILLNSAMRAERESFLNASPYERSEERIDVANGFKPKHLKTRYGTLDVEIPQIRNTNFYPSTFQKILIPLV